MSIACALAEALHHSSGSPEYDRRRVGVAQHGAVRGQTTATRARGPGTQYFTFDDEDVPPPPPPLSTYQRCSCTPRSR